MKSFTDLEQSKKLAEILPIESADMAYCYTKKGDKLVYPIPIHLTSTPTNTFKYLYCWSLSALLGALRVFTTPTAFSVKASTPSLIKTENGYKLTYIGDYTPLINNGLDIETPIESVADNPIDACYEMIVKFNKMNLS